MAKRSGKFQQARPDGQVRLSQMITTYGPGSMVDLVDHAILVAGLDFWSYDKAKALPPSMTSRVCATRWRRA